MLIFKDSLETVLMDPTCIGWEMIRFHSGWEISKNVTERVITLVYNELKDGLYHLVFLYAENEEILKIQQKSFKPENHSQIMDQFNAWIREFLS